MKVDEIKFDLKMPRDPKRSKGRHLSEILRSMAFLSGVLDPKYDTNNEEGNTISMQLGLSWENYLAAYQHPEISFHPGELSLDGIAMSPDGYSVADDQDYADRLMVEQGTWILHEFKLTKKSCRDFEEKIRNREKKALLWLWQIMAYRFAYNKLLEENGEDPNGICLLHVMFVNGNYSRKDDDPESFPTYKIFRLEFSDDDLEENWNMVKSHARSMDDEEYRN